MQPNTRLLIRFTLPNGDRKGWGYDYPYYNKIEVLRESIKNDFGEDFPENTEIRLFYITHEEVITAENNEQLADKAVEWILNTGEYYGN